MVTVREEQDDGDNRVRKNDDEKAKRMMVW
jgi:hypothetical protein